MLVSGNFQQQICYNDSAPVAVRPHLVQQVVQDPAAGVGQGALQWRRRTSRRRGTI
jgi:hypothetical protein